MSQPLRRMHDEELENATCDCALCHGGKPAMIVKGLGKEAGFLVVFECVECGQSSAGTIGMPYRPEMPFEEAFKWNSAQEQILLERLSTQPATRRSLRM